MAAVLAESPARAILRATNVHLGFGGVMALAGVDIEAYNRGVITGIVIVEAMRNAIKAKGVPLDGKKVRDGDRMIKPDDARLTLLFAPMISTDRAIGLIQQGAARRAGR